MLSFNIKHIQPIDQIDLYRETREIIYSSLTSSTMSVSKLQNSLNNTLFELKMEIMSSLTKDTKIKSLEGLVIKLGLDPSDIDAIQKIIKKKNVDIQTLRKILNLPTTKHPQTHEIGEPEKEKETLLSES